jgi:hypothetical protein
MGLTAAINSKFGGENEKMLTHYGKNAAHDGSEPKKQMQVQLFETSRVTLRKFGTTIDLILFHPPDNVEVRQWELQIRFIPCNGSTQIRFPGLLFLKRNSRNAQMHTSKRPRPTGMIFTHRRTQTH